MKRVITNNLWTFFIQAMVIVVGLISVGLLGFTGEGIAVLVAPIIYIYYGWKFLTPLPRYNWMSVLALLLALVSFYGILYIWEPFSLDVMRVLAFLNYPAILGVYFGLGESSLGDNLALSALVASFFPPLFIYFGLCIKKFRQWNNEELT